MMKIHITNADSVIESRLCFYRHWCDIVKIDASDQIIHFIIYTHTHYYINPICSLLSYKIRRTHETPEQKIALLSFQERSNERKNMKIKNQFHKTFQ